MLWLLVVCVCFPAYGERVYEVGDVFREKISNLRPTQFTVGLDEIYLRTDKYKAIRKAGELQSHLELEKPVAVVKGPGGVLYLVDGHHLTRTLHELGLKTVFVKIVEDWSKLSEDPAEAARLFRDKMKGENRTYLFDNGKKRKFRKLPRYIWELKDDPYRTLAWLYQKSKGYVEANVDFQEFQWAKFFRKHKIQIKSRDEAGWKQALEDAHEAVREASKKERAKLPGLKKGASLCLKYLEKLYATKR